MFTPELLVVFGIVIVGLSLVGLWVAGAIRDWYFGGEPHLESPGAPAPQQR